MQNLIGQNAWALRNGELIHGEIVSYDAQFNLATLETPNDELFLPVGDVLLTPQAVLERIGEQERRLKQVRERFERENRAAAEAAERENAILVAPSLLQRRESYGGIDV